MMRSAAEVKVEECFPPVVEQSSTAPVPHSDKLTIHFQAQVRYSDKTLAAQLISALEETGGKWKLETTFSGANIEVTKETTLENTKEGSRVYEMIRVSGVDLATFTMSCD